MKLTIQEARAAARKIATDAERLRRDFFEAEAESLLAVSSTEWLGRAPSSVEIDDACLSYDHSYGLMDAEKRDRLRHQATEWLRAWGKTLEERARPNVEVSRAV